MYLSYKWLKDFVEMPKNLKAEELGTRLTVHTVEIDSVASQAEKFSNVVIGQILEISKHPQADKLQLALVDVKTEKLKIVCGAPNIKVGMIVPVALVGAVLPNGMEIKPAVIRGEESHGMLCAEDELGLGEDHSGIMELAASAKIGSSFSEYLELDDVIFEVDNKSITNRPDLWGHYGMAREIATFLKTKMIKSVDDYKAENIKIGSEDIDIRVRIENKNRCSRYMAVAIDGIKIEESPKWVQNRLISVGIRPINNIVDISNYVMLELGQPMHMFDLAKITKDKKGGKVNIIVREAKKGESIKSLDGVNRELYANDLLIASNEGGIAIAGIIGGEESGIDDNTVSIVIESANFQSSGIRSTSQRFGLRTEASQRYEKSLDPVLCETALYRAVELVCKVCPNAKVISPVTDEGSFAFSEKKMDINVTWLKKFLGEEIEDKVVIDILSGLGFEPAIKEDTLSLKIPSWRSTKDVSIKEDIAEEIARIYGYDNITPKMPKVRMAALEANEELDLDKKIKNILSKAPAMFEVSNYSFVGEEQLKALGVDTTNFIRLANPISQNHTMLRQTLASNLFDNVKKNQARYDTIRIFEIGNVYLPIEGHLRKSGNENESLPLQEKILGLLVAGESDKVFMDLKGIIFYLLEEMGLESPRVSGREKLFYWAENNFSAEIKVDDTVIGVINLLDQNLGKKIGIKKTVAVSEIYLAKLLALINVRGTKAYRQAEKFPPLTRDLAFILDNNILFNDIKDEIENYHELISSIELFDEYYGDKLGKNKKSLAFHIVYQADRTLNSKEVDDIQSGLTRHMEEKFDAKVRDF